MVHGEKQDYVPDFTGVLDELRDYYGVTHRIRNQADLSSVSRSCMIL